MTAKRRIESKALTIGELLRRPVYYKVPVNQRDFSWTREEIDTLWQDLVAAMDDGRDEYFLGAIVLVPTKGGDQTLEIIDGQQRLASLTMILSAIHQVWKSRGDETQATEVQRDYLGSRDRKTRDLVPKLRLNETNDPVFEKLVLKGETIPESQRKAWPKSNRLLWEAYDRIKSHLNARLDKDDQENSLIELEEYVANSANVIAIEVGDDYDAFVIFETLNDRGLELAVSDLVKNYLFSLAEERLEAFKRTWTDLTLLLGSENLTPFLRHLWLSEYQFLRERDLYRSLREKIKTKTVARQFIDKLRKAADLYASLLNPDAMYWNDAPKEARSYLRSLRLFRAAQFRPLALAVMEGGSATDVAAMLKIVLVLTFRYTVVSKYSASELERIYSDAALAVRKSGKRNPKAIFDLVKDAYIDDSGFAENFAGATFGKADVARYILVNLNKAMETDPAVGADEDKISLEHVMPRNPGDDWSKGLPDGQDSEEWTDAIGNLTLLEKTVNRGIANKDFATKKKEGYTKSHLALNVPIASKQKWGAQEIEQRSRDLSKVAKKVWRLDF